MIKYDNEKKLIEKMRTMCDNIAIKEAKNSLNSTCAWIFFQPEMPEKLKKNYLDNQKDEK